MTGRWSPENPAQSPRRGHQRRLANACTGEGGLEDAAAMAQRPRRALGAAARVRAR